jgi:hypothetical protein
MGRLNSSFAPSSEEFLDPTMPEAPDHVYSVALHFSLVKQVDSRLKPFLPRAPIHRALCDEWETSKACAGEWRASSSSHVVRR